MPNFMKIRPMGAELFHADGQTDRRTGITKLIDAFRSFGTAPKSGLGCFLKGLTRCRIVFTF